MYELVSFGFNLSLPTGGTFKSAIFESASEIVFSILLGSAPFATFNFAAIN